MFTKIFFVVGVMMIAAEAAVDYCSGKPSNCQSDPVCLFKNGNVASKCRNYRDVPMDSAMKNALVDVHNKYRNEIALGNIPNYSSATNMATMQWDNDLANLCSLNVRQCDMVHDKSECTVTKNYPYAGQNLATEWVIGANVGKKPSDVAELAKAWFDEQKLGNYYGWMDLITKFNPGDDSAHEVLHFTQYVWAKSNRVGCAASTGDSTERGRPAHNIWLCCNYAIGNIIQTPVYIAGPAASSCKTGKNPKYPGLCSTKEEYNVGARQNTIVDTITNVIPVITDDNTDSSSSSSDNSDNSNTIVTTPFKWNHFFNGWLPTIVKRFTTTVNPGDNFFRWF